MNIRHADARDADAVWRILQPVIHTGETYALPRTMNREQALAYWLGSDRETFIAETEGGIAGTYYMRPNQMGGGDHIANCGYMTAADATGRGIAKTMCAHSLEHARRKGYRGMQFNFVVSTNERAVRLWQHMGFYIIGRLPGAFLHPSLGYVDALVMFQNL